MKVEKKAKLYMTKKEYHRLQDAHSILQEIEHCLDSPVFGDAMDTILDMINNENGYEIKVKLSYFMLEGCDRVLKNIEEFLAEEIGVPYVHCSYDSHCSHMAKNKEELAYRIKNGTLSPDEYIINYELYKTEKDYQENKGGYDGEVYELIYSISPYFLNLKAETIILKRCFHKVWE